MRRFLDAGRFSVELNTQISQSLTVAWARRFWEQIVRLAMQLILPHIIFDSYESMRQVVA